MDGIGFIAVVVVDCSGDASMNKASLFMEEMPVKAEAAMRARCGKSGVAVAVAVGVGVAAKAEAEDDRDALTLVMADGFSPRVTLVVAVVVRSGTVLLLSYGAYGGGPSLAERDNMLMPSVVDDEEDGCKWKGSAVTVVVAAAVQPS